MKKIIIEERLIYQKSVAWHHYDEWIGGTAGDSVSNTNSTHVTRHNKESTISRWVLRVLIKKLKQW